MSAKQKSKLVPAGLTSVDRLKPGATPDHFFNEYFVKNKPCIIPGVADGWPASKKWDIATMEALVKQHADVHSVELVKYMDGAPGAAQNGGHYQDMRLGDFEEYFGYLRKVTGPGVHPPQRAALKNGISIPRKAVEADCPVPEMLEALHKSQHIRLRDLMGRKAVRFFISGKGFHGRCHYDRFGYAFFSVQVKGAKTWHLYDADSLSLARDEPFDNSPREDFTLEEVRRAYRGAVAELQRGDMLFLPPYTYHSVRHEGKWNVNVDFACIPDKVWAERISGLPLALQDVGGMLGGRVLLCFGLPQLLGDPTTTASLQRALLTGAFEEEEASLVQRGLLARGKGTVEDALRTALLSASGAGMAALLLESCIACRAALSSPYAILAALALLGYQLQEHNQSLDGLADNVNLLKKHVLASIGINMEFLALDLQGNQGLMTEARKALTDAAAWSKAPVAACKRSFKSTEPPEGPVEQMVLGLAAAFQQVEAARELASVMEPPAPSTEEAQEPASGSAPTPPEESKAEPAKPQPVATSDERANIQQQPKPKEPGETCGAEGKEAEAVAVRAVDLPPLRSPPGGVMCSWTGCGLMKPLEEPKVCSCCLRVQYCSRDCQGAHWASGHNKECMVLGSVTTATVASKAPEETPAEVVLEAADASKVESDPSDQPELPDLKMEAPFTEGKLEGMLPEIKSWTRLLAQHYAAPRPKGQPAVPLPAAFVLRPDPAGGLLRPIVCELEANTDTLTVSSRWAVVDNKGVSVWVMARVAAGTAVANGSWGSGKGVLVQLCSGRSNQAFFFPEAENGILGPAEDRPAVPEGPLLVVEQLETAFQGDGERLHV